MDNASLQSLLKRLCKVMWEANVTNPITYVTQFSYLIFLKMLEEMDAEDHGGPTSVSAGLNTAHGGRTSVSAAPNGRHGGRPSIFDKVKVSGDTVDFGKLRWSVLTSDPDNDRMLRTPRHLVRVIVQMVDPTIGETVCDSAGGTGGFAIAAYEHIILASFGLVEPEKTDHAEPEEILAGVAEKERRILGIVEEMRGLLQV